MRRLLFLVFATSCCPLRLAAEEPAFRPDPASLGGSSEAALPASAPDGVAGFDPGGEIAEWDGKRWAITGSGIFDARFEAFLNAPESHVDSDASYFRTLAQIADQLAPNSSAPQAADEAFRLLVQASEFERDSGLCDAMANQVYAAWLARRASDRLAAANQCLEKERQRLEGNSKVLPSSLGALPGTGGTSEEQRKPDRERLLTRLAEVNALLKASQLRREAPEAQLKSELQSLIAQLFLQRRFQHAIIGARFYRSIFGDGILLPAGGAAKSPPSNAGGLPPTVGALEAQSNKALGSAREEMNAFLLLLNTDETGAAKRLAETFLAGEHSPEVCLLPRDTRQRVLKARKNHTEALAGKSSGAIGAADGKELAPGAIPVRVPEKTAAAEVRDDRAPAGAAILRAQEIGKRGDFAGAWESAESASRQLPSDDGLNLILESFAAKVPDFVRAIKQAEEKGREPASALAWYLKAQRIYPASDFARRGIERISVQILPGTK
ncbi:MAG: hypothetical protein WCS65_00765 [Verrucomicrobiae bacterium]